MNGPRTAAAPPRNWREDRAAPPRRAERRRGVQRRGAGRAATISTRLLPSRSRPCFALRGSPRRLLCRGRPRRPHELPASPDLHRHDHGAAKRRHASGRVKLTKQTPSRYLPKAKPTLIHGHKGWHLIGRQGEAAILGRPDPVRQMLTGALRFRRRLFAVAALIDEADSFLHDNEGLRGVLDGNRKGDTVMRTVGDDHEVRAFATSGAGAIALIGTLPDTLHDRSVVIDLKRRLAKEKVTPFRFDRAAHLNVLARKAARWAVDNAERVAASDPKMPNGIINREADNWR